MLNVGCKNLFKRIWFFFFSLYHRSFQANWFLISVSGFVFKFTENLSKKKTTLKIVSKLQQKEEAEGRY